MTREKLQARSNYTDVFLLVRSWDRDLARFGGFKARNKQSNQALQ